MQTVLLLFGGESTEHDVSISSATNIAKAIDPTKFTLIYGYIDREGCWWLVDGIEGVHSADAHQLLPVLASQSFAVQGTDDVIRPDVILPVLHGRNGEDGSVQALAQLLHLPIVGCDMTSSAAAMNKFLTKQIAMANDIAIAPFAVHYDHDPVPNFAAISDVLGAALFIKPARAGSSVGVSKAANQQQLAAALTLAHAHDDIVLIETAIDARELEVAVLGNYPDIQTSVVGEIKAAGDFYSYESKYDDDSTSEAIIPAELSPEISDQLRTSAMKIFHALGCSGMARVDFFIDKNTQQIYLNEINTIPGFTDISMYPKLWQQSGLSYGELIEQLIAFALATTRA